MSLLAPVILIFRAQARTGKAMGLNAYRDVESGLVK